LNRTKVRDIMTTDVRTIGDKMTVAVALEEMRANGIRRLPVVSNADRLIGIITEADAAQAMPRGATFYGTTPAGEEIPAVRDVMTHNVETVTPDDTLARAAQIMVSHKVGAVPVMEGEDLVGILTESDIFRYLAGTVLRED
jgi:acetoin utilization protein AcuB